MLALNKTQMIPSPAYGSDSQISGAQFDDIDNMKIYNNNNNNDIVSDPDAFLAAFCKLSKRSYKKITFSKVHQPLTDEIEKIRLLFHQNLHFHTNFKLYAIPNCLYGVPNSLGCYLIKQNSNDQKQTKKKFDLDQQPQKKIFFHLNHFDSLWWKLANICGMTLTKTLERHHVKRSGENPPNHIIRDEEIEVFSFEWNKYTYTNPQEKKTRDVISKEGITLKILDECLPGDLLKLADDPTKSFNKYSHETLCAFFGFYYLNCNENEFKNKYLSKEINVFGVLSVAVEFKQKTLQKICETKICEITIAPPNITQQILIASLISQSDTLNTLYEKLSQQENHNVCRGNSNTF